MRGQITLFIIVGLVIIISLGTIMYTTSRDITAPEVLKSTLPSNSEQFYDFFVSCMDEVGERGVQKLGEQGGYLYKNWETSSSPTQAEAVEFPPRSRIEIPYWFHMSSDNACQQDCTFEKKIPALRGAESWESDLNEFMTKELDSCVKEFGFFKLQGWDVDIKQKLETKTSIMEDGVRFYAKYPAVFIRGGERIPLDEYSTKLNVRLESIHQLAKDIVERQEKHFYLEHALYTFISANQGTDSNKLPPDYDVQVTMDSPVMWIERDVQKKVQELITISTQMIQAFGTRNFEKIQAQEGQDEKLFDAIYSRNLLFIPSEEEEVVYHLDTEVEFTYLDWWRPYFDMNCNGVCKGESMLNTFILPIGFQKYQFTYDVSWPVLVQLTDPDAFRDEGFILQYFLEGNIRNSRSLAQHYQVIDGTLEEVDSIMEGTSYAENLFCDKRTGASIELNVTNAKTGKSITDATAIYSCGGGPYADRCPLGLSKHGKFMTQLPKCIGGRLSVVHEDYGSWAMDLDTDLGGMYSLNVPLEPYRNITFKMRRIPYFREGTAPWQVYSTSEDLPRTEEALIRLSKVVEPGEEDLEVFAYVYGNQRDNEIDGYYKEIRILPGVYDVEITTIQAPQPPIVIRRTSTMAIEPIVFDRETKLPVGGAKFRTTITPDQLDLSDEVIFYSIDTALDLMAPDSLMVEDMEQLNAYEHLTANNPAVQPTFLRR